MALKRRKAREQEQSQPGSPGVSLDGPSAGMVGPTGQGQGVPAAVRKRFESATGQTLAGVRVHTGADGEAVAGARGAEAVTLGQDIFFARGMEEHTSADGLSRWGEELAHTLHFGGEQREGSGTANPGLEAEGASFGAAFATGTANASGVSQGAATGAPMHRGPNGGPSVEELAGPVRTRLREVRANGTEALIAEIRSLRSQADGNALAAINLAVEQVLTDDELAALEGGGAILSEEATAVCEEGDPPDPEASGGGDNGPEGTTDANNGEEGEEGAETTTETGEGEEEQPAPGAGPDTETDNGGGGGGGGLSVTPAVPSTSQALEPVADLPPGQRDLIQGELDFHGSWQAMQGGAGSRASQMASGLGNDLLQGGIGAGIQTGAGAGLGYLAKQIPVPGIGNMMGGAMSAYALFGNGGAGLDSMTSAIGEGFSFEGKGPWQAAADLVAGIKAILDLVGNVTNILSGLSYAFAAIAAVGGMLSFFFPPLAFLVPYIPTAINFGRACGGIASVALGVSNLISPIPAVLRAVHILVSDDDPLALAYQEEQFHGELQGAIANYGNAALDQGIETKGGDFNPLNNFSGNISGGAATARSAGSDMMNGNKAVREAFGFQGQGRDMRTNNQGQQNGRRFFDVDANGKRHGTAREQSQKQADSRNAKADRLQEQANALRPADPKAPRRQRRPAMVKQNKADRVRAQANTAQQSADQSAYRQDLATGLDGGNAQGELGNTFEGALGTGIDAWSGEGPEAQAVELQRNEQGHVVLPAPPGDLSTVDGIDSTIRQLQAQLSAQQATTGQASSIEANATQQEALLQTVETGVAERSTQHAELQAQHATVATQQAELRSQTEGQQQSTESGTQQAADVLRPWLGTAHTVNNVVQQVPSNRFFNVSGTQQNLADFVSGMEQFTGDSSQTAETTAQTSQALTARDEQLTQASDTHAAVQADTSTLQAQVAGDREQAASVASEAASERQASESAEQTLEQQIQAQRAERETKWSNLVSWATLHYNTRETYRNEQSAG